MEKGWEKERKEGRKEASKRRDEKRGWKLKTRRIFLRYNVICDTSFGVNITVSLHNKLRVFASI